MKINFNFMDKGVEEQKARRSLFCVLYPLEAGKEFVNRLLFLPFNPAKISILTKYVSPDIWTLRIPMQIHFLYYEDEGGEIQRSMFLCKREMTKLFTVNFGAGTYFGNNCSLCDQADMITGRYNRRRKEIGLWNVKMEKKEYIERVKQDKILSELYLNQKKFRPVVRYLYLVFDLDKYMGKKDILTEEISVEFLLVGKQIKDGIQAQIEAGHEFWDISKGLRVVRITKNTKEGYAPTGILHATYSVAIEPGVYNFTDPELKQYLSSMPMPELQDGLNFWEDDLPVDALIDLQGVQEQETKESEERVVQEEKETKHPKSVVLIQKTKESEERVVQEEKEAKFSKPVVSVPKTEDVHVEETPKVVKSTEVIKSEEGKGDEPSLPPPTEPSRLRRIKF